MEIGRKLMGKKRWLHMAIAMVLLVGVGVFSHVFFVRADEPTAAIVAYGDKSTDNLRVSQLLEVQTENFPADAELTYEYTVTGEEKGRVVTGVNSPSLVKGESIYADARYLYVTGSNAWKGTISVTVKDTKSEKSVTTTYEAGLEKASLTKDLSISAYGIFEGEEMYLRHMLKLGGILDVDCANTSVEACSTSDGAHITISDESKTFEYPVSGGKITCQDYKLKATASEKDLEILQVLINKTGCSLHGTIGASAQIPVHIFKKPTVEVVDTAVGEHSIKVTGGETGVIYYVDGKGQEWGNDTTELKFEKLKPDTAYRVACTYTKVTGDKKKKTAVAYTEAVKTKAEYTVKFNNRGIGDEVANQTVLSGNKVTAPTPELTAGEYNFGGWYRDSGYAGDSFPFDTTEISSNITLYAKWTEKTYTVTVNLQKGGSDWTDTKTVELYDEKGKSCYTLSGTGGVYTESNVSKGTYFIYVDGKDSNEKIEIASADQTVTVNYQQCTTTVKVDNNAVAGKEVVWVKGTQVYECTEVENEGATTYQCILPPKESLGDYSIYVDGEKTGAVGAANAEVNGYTATVSMNLDDNKWSDYTAKVSLKVAENNAENADAAKEEIVCKQDNNNKNEFSAVIWQNGSLHENNKYFVFVEGTDSSRDTKQTVTLGETKEMNYYTVSVYKDKTASTPEKQYTILGGTDFQKPASRLVKKAGYSFKCWGTKASETDVFYTKESLTINAKQDLYAYYEQATITIGDYIKQKDDNNKYYWTMPNLVIDGMASDSKNIEKIVLQVGSGSISVTEDTTYYTYSSVDGGTYVVITFKTDDEKKGITTVAKVQDILRKNVKVYAEKGKEQTMDITVYYN